MLEKLVGRLGDFYTVLAFVGHRRVIVLVAEVAEVEEGVLI
jgi:hypothetical protein